MPWIQPPPEIRRKVEQQLGDAIWFDLDRSWQKVVAVDPQMRLTQWYRSPQDVLLEKYGGINPATGRYQPPNPNAALYTQHGMGLATDVTPEERDRQAVIEAAVRQGFFVRTYGPKPSPPAQYWTRTTRVDRHIHVAAMSDAEWSRSALQSALRAILSPLLARRE